MRLVLILLLPICLAAQVVINPLTYPSGGAEENWIGRWLANNRTIELASGDITLTENSSPVLSGTVMQEGDSSYSVGTAGDYFYATLAESDAEEDSGMVEFYFRCGDHSSDNHIFRMWDASEDDAVQIQYDEYEITMSISIDGNTGSSKSTIPANDTWYWFQFYWHPDSTGVRRNGVLVDSDPTSAPLSRATHFDTIFFGDFWNAGDDAYYFDAFHLYDDPNATTNLDTP